jgi:hypothetical protein
MLHGFVSYSHLDEKAVNAFMRHLRVTEDRDPVRFWIDGRITGGRKWRREIAIAIDRADVFVTMITVDFSISDFIREHEWPAIRARQDAINALVVPVILAPGRRPGWVEEIQAIPVRRGEILAIKNWRDPESGYDAAHTQLLRAMDEHFVAWRTQTS